MNKNDINEIINEIDQIWKFHLNVRSHFPYARNEDIGKRTIESSSYYDLHGFSIKYDYGKNLEKKDIIYLNSLSNWINQNALIRLYALMNYCSFVSDTIKIDQSIDGWKELDLLRRLRNHFAHTDGRLNNIDKDQNELANEIIAYFNLDKNTYDHIPITINKVIKPIFDGCRKYSINKMKYKLT